MAQRGRKPKPIATKIAAGNPGKRPLTTLVPAPRAGKMMCPQSIQRNQRAQAYWDMYLGNAAPGHLTTIDAPLLSRLCMALAFADEATERIAATGLMVRAPNTGVPVQSPYLAVLNRQTEIARKLAAELALPPAQRNRVGPFDSDPRASAWDALEG
jgi:P27 family predicted phage terminase small subunit